jgi:hypothetical protein
MLLLGHAGITLGAALAVDMAHGHLKSQGASAEKRTRTWREPLERLSRKVDLRLLLIGSLLPDIIDKPIGLLLFPGVFGGGRLFAHTLLFVLVLTSIGLVYNWARGNNGILVLAYGSAMHLLLDNMWRSPVILLWPFLGPMPVGTTEQWLTHLFENLTQNPLAYVPEMVGAIIAAPLVWALFRRGGLLRFLRTGTVG